MRLWFDHSSEVTLHEQIVTQIRLGILSGELAPGERLPSIRELARRFHIHPNTVSAAYQQLQRESWLTGRRGSGVYARQPPGPPSDTATTTLHSLNYAIQGLLRAADSLGISRPDLRIRVLRALDGAHHNQPLLIEPDPELGRIVAWELATALGCTVDTCTVALSQLTPAHLPPDPHVLPLVLPSKAETVRVALGQQPEPFVLGLNPIAATFAQHLPQSRGALVGVASSWPVFLGSARTMLVAAGFPAEALVLRDTRDTGWQIGLNQTDALVCDALTASQSHFHRHVLMFPLIAETSLGKLRSLLSGASPAGVSGGSQAGGPFSPPNRSLQEVP